MTGIAGSSYLLDTVIVVGFFNRDPLIEQKLQQVTVYVSSTVVGELFFGAYKSGRALQNVQNINEFAQLVTILPVTVNTADWYGRIKAALQAKGRPIPENDIWIASAALEHGLTLATRDRHFQEVDHLTVEVW